MQSHLESASMAFASLDVASMRPRCLASMRPRCSRDEASTGLDPSTPGLSHDLVCSDRLINAVKRYWGVELFDGPTLWVRVCEFCYSDRASVPSEKPTYVV